MISVIKQSFIAAFLLLSAQKLFAQNVFEQQFNFAKNLFDEEKYFDAVTEFKRLLFLIHQEFMIMTQILRLDLVIK
ncbi:MAG: hypothetical protein M5T52_10455 [Ignavibacteriaceae bacterium]|nr:hypothetical protein [Ignavibacteriaceae bacterium]